MASDGDPLALSSYQLESRRQLDWSKGRGGRWEWPLMVTLWPFHPTIQKVVVSWIGPREGKEGGVSLCLNLWPFSLQLMEQEKIKKGHVLTIIGTGSNQTAKIDKTSTYLTEEEAQGSYLLQYFLVS